jgi:hypothetical protein
MALTIEDSSILAEKIKRYNLEKCEELDNYVHKEKNGNSFLLHLIQDGWEDLCFAFKINYSDFTQTNIDSVYRPVRRLIETLEKDYLKISEGGVSYFPEGHLPETPPTRLGWIKYVRVGKDDEPNPNGDFAWTTSLTYKGMEIINGYRNARGEKDLESERKERLEKLGIDK